MTNLLKFRQIFNSVCQFGAIWLNILDLLSIVRQIPFFCISTMQQSSLKLNV